MKSLTIGEARAVFSSSLVSDVPDVFKRAAVVTRAQDLAAEVNNRPVNSSVVHWKLALKCHAMTAQGIVTRELCGALMVEIVMAELWFLLLGLPVDIHKCMQMGDNATAVNRDTSFELSFR